MLEKQQGRWYGWNRAGGRQIGYGIKEEIVSRSCVSFLVMVETLFF